MRKRKVGRPKGGKNKEKKCVRIPVYTRDGWMLFGTIVAALCTTLFIFNTIYFYGVSDLLLTGNLLLSFAMLAVFMHCICSYIDPDNKIIDHYETYEVKDCKEE